MGQADLRRAGVALALLLLTAAAPLGCSYAFFSSANPPPARTRPVARIETRAGVEYGATTTEGILFLGRTAQEGPCRVHYLLGDSPTPLVEDGTIRHRGGVFFDAEIDLKTQAVALLERNPARSDQLFAIRFEGPALTRELAVQLAVDDGIEGDILDWPGESLPVGTGIFVRVDEVIRLVGLVAGEATAGSMRYVVFAGTDRLRELLATPRPYPERTEFKHRPDDITVIKKR